MTHNAIYDELVSEVKPGLERRIMQILANGHVGKDNRIARRDLVRLAIFGYGSFSLTTPADDRKVRLAIANLIEQGYPILSDSGEGGRWLAGEGEIEDYIAELESRREKLADKIRALRKAEHKFIYVAQEPAPIQPNLF